MELMLTNPCIPGVEGNIYPTAFQNGGTEYIGQEMPEINTRITEVNTKSSMGASRSLTNPDRVMEKKMHANR